MKYIGLDFETSGTDPWGTALPIEIGLAVYAGEDAEGEPHYETFDSLIGRWQWGVDGEWDEESAEVHGISKNELASAPTVKIVDIKAAAWLIEQGAVHRMENVTVGWNVAGFDRQFITRWMPALNSILSYRTVDLNALVFASCPEGNAGEYKTIKNLANTLSTEGTEGKWHRAGFDAFRSLRAWETRHVWMGEFQ